MKSINTMDNKLLEEFLTCVEGYEKDIHNEKIKKFILWCNEKEIQESIFRLSSENRSGLGQNTFLDFTNFAILITSKKLYRKFFDYGYVAGFSPLLHYILSGKIKNITEKEKYSLIDIHNRITKHHRISCNIYYKDIKKCILREGIDDIVRNMFGSAITANYLTIETLDKTYEYRLPVQKNGDFKKILYWFKICVPTQLEII